MSDVPQAETIDLRASPRPARAARNTLVVFEGESTRRFDLPAEGEVVVGRGEGAGLLIDHPSISRAHVRLVVQPGGVRLVDLGSRNGVLINDRKITDSEPLRSGDVITLGTIALVFHSQARDGGAAGLLTEDAFRAKVAQEIERTLAYQRPLALVGFALAAGTEPAEARRVLQGALRSIDAAAPLAEVLTVALPEADLAHAEGFATQTLAALAERGVVARAGLAVCPNDGVDAATLCASVRTAALAASPGRVRAAEEDVRVLSLGDQQVLVGDPVMIRLYALAERLAAAKLPLLIQGETGTGKELIALWVHSCSPRKAARLMTINCAALPEPLAESALFGHEQGAFSGATESRPGLLETATGGTVFLDEVGELSPAIQAKLLRALDTGRLTRVGATAERAIDVRFVAATHRTLEADVKAGRFREDLFFRLAGAVLVVPPLRERPRELPALARRFLDQACLDARRSPMTLSAPAFAALEAHPWPGNVRELKSTMAFLAATVVAETVDARHLSPRLTPGKGPAAPDRLPPDFVPLADQLRALEKAQMRRALDATGWNKTRAAAALAMPLRTFLTRVKKLGLTR